MMNTQTMLQAIAQHSDNDLCKHICLSILNGDTTIEAEKEKNHCGFICAILEGDVSLAWNRADSMNKRALSHYYWNTELTNLIFTK